LLPLKRFLRELRNSCLDFRLASWRQQKRKNKKVKKEEKEKKGSEKGVKSTFDFH
jgi:hypothetical protein